MRHRANLVCYIGGSGEDPRCNPVQYITCRDISAGEELVVSYRQSHRKTSSQLIGPTNVKGSSRFDFAPFLQGNNYKMVVVGKNDGYCRRIVLYSTAFPLNLIVALKMKKRRSAQ